MSYQAMVSVERSDLGGNIDVGDIWSFSPNCWNFVIDRFAINSVLDLGSGLGYSANYFHKKGLKVVAADGLDKNIQQALYPTVKVDLTKTDITCPVDLVHCQEVVEHIEEQYLDNLLRSLANGKFIMITHALPGQTGYHHVNEQSSEYWIHHMHRYNCHFLDVDTHLMRQIAEPNTWLSKTGLLFVNKDYFKY